MTYFCDTLIGEICHHIWINLYSTNIIIITKTNYFRERLNLSLIIQNTVFIVNIFQKFVPWIDNDMHAVIDSNDGY